MIQTSNQPAGSAPSLSLGGISKTFGSFRALDDLSLDVEGGQLVALLGPSGSGKTTLLRLIAGLDFPDPGGFIRIGGEDVAHLPTGKRRIGFVFQHYALFRHMTVAENIAFGLKSRMRSERPTPDAIRERVEELLDIVMLPGLGHRLPHELSGGQRQRIALARGLAIKPRLLLLDEPFGALDAKVRKDLRRWLREFHVRSGLTTVFVTHDQEEALELADEVVIMNHARIEQKGVPQDVYDRPANRFVVEFLGDVNRLDEEKGLYVRPHEIELIFAGEADPAKDRIGRIGHVFAAGPVARIQVELQGGKIVDVEASRSQLEALAIDQGDEVGLRFENERVYPPESAVQGLLSAP